MGDQDQRDIADTNDRGEIVDRIERHVLREQRIEDVRRKNHHQGGAVCGRARDEFGADHAVGAGLVFDHHGDPERLFQSPANSAGECINGASSRGRNDPFDGAVRVPLRSRRGRGAECENKDPRCDGRIPQCR